MPLAHGVSDPFSIGLQSYYNFGLHCRRLHVNSTGLMSCIDYIHSSPFLQFSGYWS